MTKSNLSLLSASGVLKNAFKNWLKLPSLNDVNYLAKYGFIHDDRENRKVNLHPLIREIVALETLPSVSNCHTLLDSLHCICLVHGLEVKRQEYAHLGLAESHDMLQQLMNLTNILILSKNAEMAKQVLSAYESLVLEHEVTQTLDNGICQMMYGAIALSEVNAKEAELHLLSVENIITEVIGTDNDYVKTVYLYLNNLYSRWQKPEQALAYKNKYLECSK